MLLNLSDLSSEPLHRQISRQIRASILAGDLEDGASLPSIRGLSRDQKVSVITVQRAYEDLEREGLIRARRGKGFFVARIDDEEKKSMAEERFTQALDKVLKLAFEEGLDPKTVRRLFERSLDHTVGSRDSGVSAASD